MVTIRQGEYSLECGSEDGDIHVLAKWDGCCDIRRYYNGYTYKDTKVPEDEVDYIHICDLRGFIKMLTEIADKAESIDGFDGYENPESAM